MSTKVKTEPKEHLPVISAPPSLTLLSQPRDEVAQAFAAEATDRRGVQGISLATIDHDTATWKIDGNPVERMEGYIVHWFQARAFWTRGYNSRDTGPPDCWSNDMLKPHVSIPSGVKQSATCAACPKAQFGSAPMGKGQACKTNTFLFVINPELGPPPIVCLVLPPSSIKPMLGGGRSPGYLQRANQFKDPGTGKKSGYYELVWTDFRLESGGDKHCVVAPEGRFVCPNVEEARVLAGLRKQFMDAMNALRGQVQDVATGADSGESH